MNTKAIDSAGFEIHVANGWVTLTRGGKAFTVEWSRLLDSTVQNVLAHFQAGIDAGFLVNAAARESNLHILDYLRREGLEDYYKQCRDAYVGMLRLGVTETEWESFA